LTLDEFRTRLIHAFPAEPFLGSVSAHDDCDEGIALRSYLPGKRWTDVTADFVEFNSGSLPLLESPALVAFLPAWLLRSIEMLPEKGGISESAPSEFTIYFLCPGDPEDGWNADRTAELVRLFNVEQRTAVCDFLSAVKERFARDWEGQFVEFGLTRWGRGAG